MRLTVTFCEGVAGADEAASAAGAGVATESDETAAREGAASEAEGWAGAGEASEAIPASEGDTGRSPDTGGVLNKEGLSAARRETGAEPVSEAGASAAIAGMAHAEDARTIASHRQGKYFS